MEALLYSEHAIWVVCAAFYLSDLFRLPPTDYLIIEQRSTGFWPIVPLYRYLLRGRAFTLLNPLMPWRASFSLPWLTTGVRTEAVLRRTRRRHRLFRGRLWSLQIATVLVFLDVIVVGPVVTHFLGIGMALVVTVPVFVGAWMVFAAAVIGNRRLLNASWPQVGWLLIEHAICPGYLANAWRRVSIAWSSEPADAVAYCSATLGADAARDLNNQIDGYVTDLATRG